jgi:hypothetical protein
MSRPVMDLDLDPTLLVVSLIPSGIGFVLFTYGRKEHRWPQLVTGLLLMVYPYFIGSTAALAGVGVSLVAALYLMLSLGW